jgi:hypothetical protein
MKDKARNHGGGGMVVMTRWLVFRGLASVWVKVLMGQCPRGKNLGLPPSLNNGPFFGVRVAK